MNRLAAQPTEPTDNPLRKPVNTLAIVPTKSSKITVLARKAYNVLLYIAQEQGIEQEVFRAPLQSILRGVDFNSNAREIVKQHLRAMVSTTVEWQSPTAGEGDAWNVAGLLAHAKVYKQGGEKLGSSGRLPRTSNTNYWSPSALPACAWMSFPSCGGTLAWCSTRSVPAIGMWA